MEQKQKMGLIPMFVTAVSKPSEYEKVTGIKKRTVVGYVFLVTLLTSIFSVVIPTAAFLVSIGGPKHFLTESLPKFECRAGKFSIEKRIVMEYPGIRIIADDQVDSYKKEDLDEEALVEVLVSKNNMILKNAANDQNYRVDFSKLKPDQVFNNQTLAGLLPLLYAGAAAGFLIAYMLAMINYLFLSFVISLFGRSFCQMRKKNLSVGQLFIYAMMARTTTELISAMGTGAGIKFFQGYTWEFIQFAIMLGYMYVGVKGKDTNKNLI